MRKNYLINLYKKNKLEKEDINISESKTKNTIKISLYNKEYKDPDSYSDELYKDLYEYLKIILPEVSFELCERCIKAYVDNKCITLSSDYIGPSKHWAIKTSNQCNNKKCESLANILNVARKFGGHIIWPTQISVNKSNISLGNVITINTGRGGQKGLWDCFDIFLYLLKIYYQNFIEINNSKNLIMDRFADYIDKIDFISHKSHMSNIFRIFVSFELSYDWLCLFKSFKNFIDTFDLNNFIDGNKEYDFIRSIKKNDTIDKCLDNYDEYINYSLDAIEKRDLIINDKYNIGNE